MFTFCELTLTDSVGHDRGAHSEALRDALDETDLRIGRLLRLLDERGLFESTLFVMTTDHGMAATKTELAANQVANLPVRLRPSRLMNRCRKDRPTQKVALSASMITARST